MNRLLYSYSSVKEPDDETNLLRAAYCVSTSEPLVMYWQTCRN